MSALDKTRYPQEWSFRPQILVELADEGKLVFGPGPRKWTFDWVGQFKGVFHVIRVEHNDQGTFWILRKAS